MSDNRGASVASTGTTNSQESQVASPVKAGKATKTTASGKGGKAKADGKVKAGGKGTKKAGGKGGKVKIAASGTYSTRSARAGVAFPVGRIHRLLRKGRHAQRIGAGAPVYMASVLEYLAAEVLELAGNAAKENKKLRITPRHLQLAVRNDEELNKLLSEVTISRGGVLPNIQTVLLSKMQQKKQNDDSQKQFSMAPPVEKKQKKLLSAIENQQQSLGSVVTPFGKRRSVRLATKKTKRTLMKIWICNDVLMDILPFLDHTQLGLKMALISPRFDALVDTHFGGKTELTIWKWIAIYKDKGSKAKFTIRTDDDYHKFEEFPLPDHALPNKIRFRDLRIEYIDHSVITFLRSNKQIFDRNATYLELDLFSDEIENDDHPVWELFARQIWPIFATNIHYLHFAHDEHLEILCRRISLTILTDLDQLNAITFDVMYLGESVDEISTGGQLLSEWLHISSKNGKPKQLYCGKKFDVEGNLVWIDSFEETFLCATASASYEIKFGVCMSTITSIEPFELVNGRTNEKLTLTMSLSQDKEENYKCNWLLKRCPIGETAAQAAHCHCEYGISGKKFNNVQFYLWGECIGPLLPPTAAEEEKADQSNENI
ncbi:hypothetical protein niasHT_029092 [Heterodera trifolii]|uniref:Histone H2A n=1 Tax=Heterodera trifolii TaxID=157864 RepID=A0ABD2KNL0_9BILA